MRCIKILEEQLMPMLAYSSNSNKLAYTVLFILQNYGFFRALRFTKSRILLGILGETFCYHPLGFGLAQVHLYDGSRNFGDSDLDQRIVRRTAV